MRIQILILRFKGLRLVVICLENPRRLAILLFPGYPKFCQIMKLSISDIPNYLGWLGTNNFGRIGKISIFLEHPKLD